MVGEEWVEDPVTHESKKVVSERLGVAYSELIPVLIKSIQELKEETDLLKSKIKELENK